MNYDINSPGELRELSVSSLPKLCEELRSFLIDHVASNGGHFSSSLGVVELAVALHYVFDTPEDKLVWDVGHQAYPHKLLTGRKGRFYSNRLFGGISGFPVMEESEFDAFGTGHSSTSLSAILGMALAARYRGEDRRQHIAVIGGVHGPFAIRYPKGAGKRGFVSPGFRKLEIGKGRKIRSGRDIAILSLGPIGQEVKEACKELEQDQLDVAHYDLRFFKPLDEALLHEVFRDYPMVITIEDGCVTGGVGSGVMEFMVEQGYHCRLKRLGLPDGFAVQGTQQELQALYGYDKKAIVSLVRSLCVAFQNYSL